MARFHNNHNRNNHNKQNQNSNSQNHNNNNQSKNGNYNNNNRRNSNRGDRNQQLGTGFQGKCDNCSRIGHKAADCRSKNIKNNNINNDGNRVGRPQSTNRNNGQNGRHGPQGSNRWCVYCKNNTHNTEACRYPPKICGKCLKKGHEREQCRDPNPNLPVEQDANGNCNWCHQPWHAGNQCLQTQIEERGAHPSIEDLFMGDAPSSQIIQSQLAVQSSLPPPPPAERRPSFHPSNPLATINAHAWAPRVFAANMAQHEQHRRTCETCEATTHRTTECLAIHPCTACGSPFHPRAGCLDVHAAQAVLKPAVALWQKRPEHVLDPRYCVYCNATGHTTEVCRDEGAQIRHLASPLRCGQCGKRGHADAHCLNPTAQWGGPPTLHNLREQDWACAWVAGWRPACSKCEFAMDVYDVWNGDVDAAMGGSVSGKLFIPAHVCKDSVVWWVKMEE